MPKLTKTRLIQNSYKALQDEGELDLTRREVEGVINKVIALMQSQLIQGEKVLLSGFMAMGVKTYKGRKYSNPSNQKILTVPPRKRPRANFSDLFIRQVSEANPVKKTSSRSKKS